MIVTDTNLISYLHLQGPQTEIAERVLSRDAHWIAPLLWRSEFRNVLTTYVRQGLLSLDHAVRMMTLGEERMREREFSVPSDVVLALASDSGCSAYDCEFVALAEQAAISLVTSDRKILKAFPRFAIDPQDFIA